MPDREKVIKGLEVCTSIEDGESCPKECPYYQDVCYGYDQLMRDALALIKEQEAVLIEWKYGFPHCPVCGQMLPEGDAVKYCLHCGQAVKWDA